MKKEGVLKTYLTVRYLYKYIINLLSIRFSILQFLQFLYISIENLFLDFQWGTMICFIHSLIKILKHLTPIFCIILSENMMFLKFIFGSIYFIRTMCCQSEFIQVQFVQFEVLAGALSNLLLNPIISVIFCSKLKGCELDVGLLSRQYSLYDTNQLLTKQKLAS